VRGDLVREMGAAEGGGRVCGWSAGEGRLVFEGKRKRGRG